MENEIENLKIGEEINHSLVKENELTNDDYVKRDICSSPYTKYKNEPTSEEIQNKIDEINEKYNEESNENNDNEIENDSNKESFNNNQDDIENDNNNEGAINIDQILISRNIKQTKFIKQDSFLNSDLKDSNSISNPITNTNTNNNTNKLTTSNSSSNITPKSSSKQNLNTKDHKISEFEIINQDPYLKPFEKKIKERIGAFNNLLKEIEKNETSLLEFSQGYKKLGFTITENGVEFKEYAPGAKSMTIFGDFNNWNRDQYPCKRDEFGFWSIHLPIKSNGEFPIRHNTRIKINLKLANNKREDRNPVWSKYLIQNKDSLLFDAVFWNPPEVYQWKTPSFQTKPKSLKIYEAHVGMSLNEPKVASYREFADVILPRIIEAGYTAVQLMAIMEHAYYGSFGYHVTNFFAVSSRSGTPDDLKYLIDKAHEMGLFVIIDIIHSHASSNVLDGINLFDGTDYLYFHGGAKGFHTLWDSRVFNYKNWETLRLLLSNLSWYTDEYHFDGFRFDGVTSMLYKNHGINYSFSGGYADYFNSNVDFDGEVYLMMANYLIHLKNPQALTIAEDVSGMPTLCRPIEEGGFGFDYRLNMSVPDKWIQLLKEYKDEQWNVGDICYTLTNRRHLEKHVTYSESHDQCIVGDKTISMWLFDQEIYYNMGVNKRPSIIVDRGMALHKMIRLITFTLGGEAYMNFIGNEFGHPEWVDFPRPGNNFSFDYCKRQWNLCDDVNLRYKYLFQFDKYMNILDNTFGILNARSQCITLIHEIDKLIVFEKGDLLFIFNFHPSKSLEHYRIGTKWASEHLIVLDTDESRFGGEDRLNYGKKNFFPIIKEKWNNRNNYIHIYIPSRTAIVLIAKENLDKYDLESLSQGNVNK